MHINTGMTVNQNINWFSDHSVILTFKEFVGPTLKCLFVDAKVLIWIEVVTDPRSLLQALVTVSTATPHILSHRS